VLRLVTPPRDAAAVVVPAQRPPSAAVPAQRGPVDSECESAAEPAGLNGFGALRPSADDEPVLALSGVDRADERSDGEPGPARLIGFRVVRRDGSAVGGACVSLLDVSGREVVTGYADTQGCGELRAPRPARYLLVSTAPDHQPAAVTVSTVDGAAEAELSLIRSASMIGSVRGNRGPIIGARLTLVADGENVGSAESGSDGGYRLRDLAAGAYRLSVDAAGCLSIALPLDIADGAQLQRDIDLEPTHRVIPAESDVDESGVERLMIGNG
jgi:Carboxypeptidase regulatory-like domain